jgi:serine/threonine-protein kinase RsbW
MVALRRSLRVPAELAHLADLRALAREAAVTAGATGPCIDDVAQAVDEAATNVIVHGFAGRSGWLELTVAHEDDRLVMTLTDDAPPFDPTTHPEPDLSIPPERRRPGGMGIHLIRLAVDTMRHRPRPGGGNILTLTRTIDPRPMEDRPMPLETVVEQAEGRVPITIVALAGELDASNFESLVTKVADLYGSGTRHLLLDLTDLRFMASSGLVALHSIMRVMHGEQPDDAESGWDALHTVGLDAEAGSTQSEVQLCGAQAAVQRVLDRTGMSRLFRVHPDRASAIGAF